MGYGGEREVRANRREIMDGEDERRLVIGRTAHSG